MTRQFEGTEKEFVYDSEAGYERLDKKYRAKSWGKITDEALCIRPSNVESLASDVAMWARERITELEAKAEQAAALITSQAAEIERLREALANMIGHAKWVAAEFDVHYAYLAECEAALTTGAAQ